MIAMSIANNPKLIIADEQTALDVTIQMQILELLSNLQNKLGMTMLFISHDISVVKKIADFVYVMKEGVVKRTKEIFNSPSEEYTKKFFLK